MEELNKVYKELTSIDIEQQKKIWDERGKGYWGEYLVFTKLYQNIQGQAKILMNLNVPTEYGTAANRGKTTEIDLLMIHESGLYVFEIKYYKGTIYGDIKSERWTQFFRTKDNSHFNSPVRQNEYHIQTLRKLFPSLQIHSFIIFTNPDAQVKVTGWQDTDIVVCRLDELDQYINKINTSENNRLSSARIDEIFRQLESLAPMMTEKIMADGEERSLADYINTIQENYNAAIKEQELIAKEKYRQKNRIIIITAVSVAVILCVAALLVSGKRVNIARGKQICAEKTALQAEEKQLEAENQLEEMLKRFRHAEPYNGGDIKLTEDFFETYDIDIRESKDLQNTVLFSCSIRITGEQYGIQLSGDNAIIVQMKDGTIAEYLFSDTKNYYPLQYVGPFNGYRSEIELPVFQIYQASVKDIAYIKLINVNLCKYPELYLPVISGLEFELYKNE